MLAIKIFKGTPTPIAIFGPVLSNRGRYWSRSKVSWRSAKGDRRSCGWL